MYVPKHFEETRVEVLHRLIAAEPLAALVTLGADGLCANHVPFELDPEPAPFGTLRGHVSRANPVWRDFAPDVGALAIFQGPDAYVSPSWYETKRATGAVVPTWNYVVVHARGPLEVIEDRDWLLGLVTRLTDHHESGRREPWRVTDAPADYVKRQLGAIVGLEIPITRLTGKWKLGQNRSADDRRGVAEGLAAAGTTPATALAELVGRPKRA